MTWLLAIVLQIDTVIISIYYSIINDDYISVLTNPEEKKELGRDCVSKFMLKFHSKHKNQYEIKYMCTLF